MRRTALTTSFIVILGAVAIGSAQTCGTMGPAAKSFPAGSLVIPMDNCYQKRDSSAPNQTAGCNATADDGVFRAYGLVYFLLKHNVPVYWAIDNTKNATTAPDVVVPGAAGVVAAQVMNWSNGTFANQPGLSSGSGISYIGGPFIIDGGDVATYNVVSLLQTDPDFAPFKAQAVVDIHLVQTAFSAKQVRPLAGPPPKIAILYVTPPAGKKTSANVMYQYAVAAGLSWPCTGNNDCAGGLGPSCSKSAVLAYLANPAGDTKIPQVCNGTSCAPNFNQGPGLIYDILCDNDFVPPGAGKTYADTALAQGGYKLLWVPHWDTDGTTPTGSSGTATPALPPANASDTLAWQLQDIASFVNAGNNLFVECLGIQAMEGVAGQTSENGNPLGIPATRFQTNNGIYSWNWGVANTSSIASGAVSNILAPANPDMQVGDFQYALVSGAIMTYDPDEVATSPLSLYLANVTPLINDSGSSYVSNPWRISSTIQVQGTDGSQRGTVAYLGGHDYSPSVGCTPTSSGCTKGSTAGTRIVLNTLFNLGFGCSDPNTTCTTGLLGNCAQGVLKCASGGGFTCTGSAPGALDCVTPGADANCNGVPDADEQGCQATVCQEGTTQSCYDGPTGTAGVGICKSGTQTCTGGLWGPCVGEVTPHPEVCNGLDDDCDGTVDDPPSGGSLCDTGFSCQNGVCLPTSCNGENARCPTGFTCTSGTCQANCSCPAGQVCGSSGCVDPCAGVTCGPGSSCSGGQCLAGGCSMNEVCYSGGQVDTTQDCIQGVCVPNPCAGLTCPTGTFCRVGPMVNGTYVADCVRSCSYVSCPTGQACDENGFCESTCSPACTGTSVCQNGTCVTDPCAGVTCAPSQVCSQGACIDNPCLNITCPVGSCSGGQCVNGGITSSTQNAVPAASGKSGGCSSSGTGGLVSWCLLLAFLVLRRLRLDVRFLARRGRVFALALVSLGATGCGKGSSSTSCSAGQTACGSACVTLATDTNNCGNCGRACSNGFTCTAGACALATGNPRLVSVAPSTIGLGASPTFTFTFDGLAAAPTALSVRLSGVVAAQELPLTLGSGGTATLPAQALALNGESTGTIQATLLNMPGRLASNTLSIQVVNALLARALTPALAQQDQVSPVTLNVQGFGFIQGAVISMGPTGGAAQPLATTFISAGELTAVAPTPNTLPVGTYSVTVTNPDGSTSSGLTFTVTDGAPSITSVSGSNGTCVVGGTTFSGSVAGSYFYPNSVVHVTGNLINNSPLDTSCLNGTAASGQCQGGQLRVNADLTAVPFGTYQLTVVNPGATPLISSSVQITVAASCP